MKDSLQFSQQPGMRERHLQRRAGNILFGERAQVTQQEIDEAREADLADQQNYQQELQQLFQDASEMSGQVDTDIVLDLKERTDKLYELACGLPGDRDREKQGMLRFNEVIMRAIRTAAGNDPLAIQEMEREQQARQMHLKLLDYPMVPHLLHTETPVIESDLVPTLLSSDVETVHIVMSLFDPEQQQEIRDRAMELVELTDDRDLPSLAKECLSAMQTSH